MKIVKKVSIGGAYARKAPYEYEGKSYEADIKNGDTITILNEGSIVSGQFGEQHVFSIQTRNGEKNFTANQTTLNVLHDELGEDSKDWVGKSVRVITKKDVVAGKKVEIAYLVSGDWALDEWGDLTKAVTDGSAPEYDEPMEEVIN
jgi:hypothetical protein